MELKLNISSINEKYSLTKIQKVNIQTFDENEYLKMFKQLVELKIISGKFEYPIWKVFDKMHDMYAEYKFDIEIYSDINKALKYYTVLRLISGREPGTVYSEIQNIKLSVLNSSGLKNTDDLEIFFHKEYSKGKERAGSIARHLSFFLEFLDIENGNRIKVICEKFPNVKYSNRDLPHFDHVMKFDNIINDYFRKNDPDMTFEYLPIMMWWLLTNILPLRPTEFLMLKKDCMYVDIRNNSPVYLIKVSRTKKKPREETIEIDESTYNIMNKAIFEIHNKISNDTPYLFTIDLYYFEKERKTTRKKRSNKRMNRRDFYDILDSFYEKVVKEIYQESELEKIKMGDTRHFAIINMCLQGFNMLSIARMAGHDDIYTQDNYFSHAGHYAQSYVYTLAQKKLENSITGTTGNGIIGWKRYIYDKGKGSSIFNFNQQQIVGRINYGFCTEDTELFPNNCIEDCRLCNKFLFNPTISEYDEGIKWLSDCSKSLEIRINEAIELMRDIATARGKSKTYNNFSSENILKTTSRQLTSYMDMKATVDAKMMEAKNNEKKRWD